MHNPNQKQVAIKITILLQNFLILHTFFVLEIIGVR
jgi:hypothetical protein